MDINKFRSQILSELPINSTLNDVLKWLNSKGFEHSGIYENKIYASLPVRRWLFIKTKWLIVFYFDELNLLSHIDVREGYVAP